MPLKRNSTLRGHLLSFGVANDQPTLEAPLIRPMEQHEEEHRGHVFRWQKARQGCFQYLQFPA